MSTQELFPPSRPASPVHGARRVPCEIEQVSDSEEDDVRLVQEAERIERIERTQTSCASAAERAATLFGRAPRLPPPPSALLRRPTQTQTKTQTQTQTQTHTVVQKQVVVRPAAGTARHNDAVQAFYKPAFVDSRKKARIDYLPCSGPQFARLADRQNVLRFVSASVTNDNPDAATLIHHMTMDISMLCTLMGIPMLRTDEIAASNRNIQPAVSCVLVKAWCTYKHPRAY